MGSYFDVLNFLVARPNFRPLIKPLFSKTYMYITQFLTPGNKQIECMDIAGTILRFWSECVDDEEEIMDMKELSHFLPILSRWNFV